MQPSNRTPPLDLRNVSLGSVVVNLQLVRQVAMCLHPVPRPGQCSAQLVEVLAETRRADRLSQEVATHRLPAYRVERLEERPYDRRKHSMLTSGDKLAAPPVHVGSASSRLANVISVLHRSQSMAG